MMQRLNRSRCLAAAGVLAIAACCTERHATPKAEPLTDVWKALKEGKANPAAASRAPAPPDPPIVEETEPKTLQEQREGLYARMKERLQLSDDVLGRIKALFEGSKVMGQGNPAITEHPMTRKACREIRASAGLPYYTMHPPCGVVNMVPIYNTKDGQTDRDAQVCIDQYEFPNLPCEYPVVHVQANEAVELCQAMGKRLCDAHEWEGACAGSLRAAALEYAWGKDRGAMKWTARDGREIVWAYGAKQDHTKCATGSHKNKKCGGGGWKNCGSNTYPTGAFPLCVSRFGVFDQHGNAAEHMNLPMNAEQVASKGTYGETEMKGSWFVFQTYSAHEDDCRWRAPDWHVSKVMDRNSHSNYHLGFRCCMDVKPHVAP